MATKKYNPSVEELAEDNSFLSDATIGTTHVQHDQDLLVSNEGLLDNIAIRAKEWFQSDDKYYQKELAWDFKTNKVREEAKVLQAAASKKTSVKIGAPLITLPALDIYCMGSGLNIPKTIPEFGDQLNNIKKVVKLLTDGVLKDYENYLRVTIDTSKSVIKDVNTIIESHKRLAAAYYPSTANRLIKTQTKVLTGGNKFNETSDVYNSGTVLTRYEEVVAGMPYRIVWEGRDKEFTEKCKKMSYAIEALKPEEVVQLTQWCGDAVDVLMQFSERLAATHTLYNQARNAINTYISFIRTPIVDELDIQMKTKLANYYRCLFHDIDTFMHPWITLKNNTFLSIQVMMLICRKSVTRQH